MTENMANLHDIVVPLITPLTDNDNIDIESLEKLTEYLIGKDVDCLYPCGTTGEMAYLTDEERMTVLEVVVNQADGRLPVFAQVGASNTASTLKLAKHATSCGANGVGVVTPWYFQLSDEEIVSFYQEISASLPADYPLFLYAIPQNAVNDISPKVAAEITRTCSNVVGIKYSFPNMTKIQEFMTICDGDFDVLVGPDHLYQAVLAVGGKGVVSGNAMIIPEHYCAIRDSMANSDWSMAIQMQRRTNILNKILCERNNIAAYKVVLKALGVIETSKMRRPFQELPMDYQEKLLQSLVDHHYQDPQWVP